MVASAQLLLPTPPSTPVVSATPAAAPQATPINPAFYPAARCVGGHPLLSFSGRSPRCDECGQKIDHSLTCDICMAATEFISLVPCSRVQFSVSCKSFSPEFVPGDYDVCEPCLSKKHGPPAGAAPAAAAGKPAAPAGILISTPFESLCCTWFAPFYMHYLRSDVLFSLQLAPCPCARSP
jgi:hypothetical protein